MVGERVRGTHCPICDGPASQTRFLCTTTLAFGSEFDLVQCDGCGVMFFSPLPTPGQLAAFYGPHYYDFERFREEGKGRALARRLTRWRPTGRLLDVGCATGFFINGVRNHSRWEVVGTDIGEQAVRVARETLGLNVTRGELIDAHLEGSSFDYVHVNNVLEHVRDPVALLRECRRVVKPDGLFYLSVPNGPTDVSDLLAFSRIEGLPARSKKGHIFFFPPQTILDLLCRTGFEVIDARTYSWKPGLRSLGLLPRRRNWKKDYFPKREPEPQTPGVAPRARTQALPYLYYEYRYVQNRIKMLPGLHRYGLDYMFLMKPLQATGNSANLI